MVPASKSVEKLAETAAVYLGRSPTESGVDRLMDDLKPSPAAFGPWQAEYTGVGTASQMYESSVYDDAAPIGGKLPAVVYGRTKEEARARGNLIAAAPDLLEACKMLVDAERVHEQFRNDTSGGVNSTGIAAGLLLEIATKKARAAIAKAGGAL